MEEPLVTFADVTTIMALLVNIRDDLRSIREALVDDDGEEEDPQAD